MIIYNGATNQIQCIQNPTTITMAMCEENDDVNIIPLLPLDVLLHIMFRGNGPLLPRMIATPSLSELEDFKPIKTNIQYDLYNRETFMHFAYVKQEEAKKYGQKMLLKGSLNGLVPIITEDVEWYYQIAQQLLIERETVMTKPMGDKAWLEMVKILKPNPYLPTTKRRIWHETVAEAEFVRFCKQADGSTDDIWTNRKVIDCRGALKEWKEVHQSKLVQAAPITTPLNEIIQPPKTNPILMAQKYIAQIARPKENGEIEDYELELLNLANYALTTLAEVRKEKVIFQSLDGDKDLLSDRCLPTLNKVLKTNRKAMRVKELVEQSTQADIWETEWTDQWSNTSMQTNE